MKRNHALGSWVNALVALMSACGLDSGREARPAMQRQHFEQEADDRDAKKGLVAHIVDPKDTDPAIDYKAPGNHYAWLDTGAQTNHQLLVFMPGTGVSPASYQLVQREAARLGYHVIGLMYVNGVRLAGACPGTADANACFEDSRLEILDGIHRDRSVVNVNVPNSIYNRLPKLLEYLGVHHPEEGWSRFLSHGQPRWRRIAVGGHSQGGGQAALIAKLHLVARVVLFSAVPDRFRATGATPWVGMLATPSARHWGLAHDRDPFFVPIHASWDLLGMAALGGDKAPETIDAPYGFTHMLVTDLVPQGGSFIAGAHSAPVGDDFTPLSADGTPLLRDAWRYMLGAQDGDDNEGEDESGQQGCVFGAWSTPVNMGPVINSPGDQNIAAWITKDGLSLYFSTTRFSKKATDFDIAVSRRSSLTAPWGTPMRLGPNVNTVGFNEGFPSISEDGFDLYFASIRPGGFGTNNNDVYVSHRNDPTDDSAWQPAVNLGPNVNSSSPENGPDFFQADETDYLYYVRFPPLLLPGSIGNGPNIVLSTRPTGSGIEGWSKPVVVTELNSIYTQGRPSIRRADGLEMCISRGGDPAGFGSTDIYCSTRSSLSSSWSTPVNLGPTINTRSEEGGQAFDFSGKTLYFQSDRVSGFGMRDLYTATRPQFCTPTADCQNVKVEADNRCRGAAPLNAGSSG